MIFIFALTLYGNNKKRKKGLFEYVMDEYITIFNDEDIDCDQTQKRLYAVTILLIEIGKYLKNN